MKSFCKKTMILVMLAVSLILSACGKNEAKVSKTDNADLDHFIVQFLNSHDNPLKDSYRTYSYSVDSFQNGDAEKRAIIHIDEESAKTHLTMQVTMIWRSGDDKAAISAKTDDYYPLQGPDASVVKEFSAMYPGANVSMDISTWNYKEKSFSCPVEIRREYKAYIETIVERYELSWSVSSEQWGYLSKERVSHQYDFSPIDGKWNAVFSHSTAILTKDDIPFSITFSHAGVIKEENDVYTTASVDVQHELNQIWQKYLNPELAETYGYRDSVFDSGKMEIVHDPYKGFVIQFFEVNGDYKNPQVIYLGQEKLTFDGWTCRDCVLSK